MNEMKFKLNFSVFSQFQFRERIPFALQVYTFEQNIDIFAL